MKKPAFLFILVSICLQATNSFGQFSHVKEYGFKGKAREIITYTYDSLHNVNHVWEPVDKNIFKQMLIEYFNRSGFLDSSALLYQIKGQSYHSSRVYDYSKGTDNYTCIQYYERTPIQKATFKWLDSFKFEIVSYNQKGKLASRLVETLNSLYREKVSECKYWDYDGVLTDDYTYEETIDADNHLIASKSIDHIHDSTTKVRYKISKYDKMNNPLMIAEILLPSGKLKSIRTRKIKYY